MRKFRFMHSFLNVTEERQIKGGPEFCFSSRTEMKRQRVK